MPRRSLLALAFLLAAFSLTLLVTGGFVVTVAGARVSARSPRPAAAGAIVSIAVWALLAIRSRAAADDLVSIDSWLVRRSRGMVLSIAGVAAAIAIAYGSFAAAGSDASGYLSHAAMLGSGRLARAEPLAAVASWPNALQSLTPLGWRQAQDVSAHVPTYPAGLPLLMVPLDAIGGTIAASLIVPMGLLVAVWATGRLARRVAGPQASLLASVWLATSPIALIDAMQPMSDVPVTAAWLLCWVAVARERQRPLLAGLAAAIAIVIRPNLAPLAAIPALSLLLGALRHSDHGSGRAGDSATPDPASRVLRAVWFSAPVVAAGLLTAGLQWRLYGAPFESGHGSAANLYSPSSFAANAVIYTRWLIETHGPWLLAAPLALFTARVAAMRWLLAFAGAVVAAYLIYGTFDVWTYLRFLLPALAIAMIAVAAVVVFGLERLPAPVRGVALLVIMLLLAVANIAAARSHGVFRLADREGRALLAGHYLAIAAPDRSVILAGEESGALRYYTGRSILRWDVLTAEALAASTDRLRAQGYDLWIALDDWEEELFRRKFPDSAIGALEWPPAMEAGVDARVRAWRFRDRERYMRGERVITDRLR